MDCLSSIKTAKALPLRVETQRRGVQVSSASVRFSNPSRKSNLLSQNLLNAFGTPKSALSINGRRQSQVLRVTVAHTEPIGSKYSRVRTPLEPSSPEGRFLSAILQNHRHLFLFAVSEQLNELASNRDEAATRKIQHPSSMESILHKRIADMKEKERQNAVEDVIYMSIVHKFSDSEVPMVPKLSESITENLLEILPSMSRELESIHDLEIQDLIREHVSSVLRIKGKSFLSDESTTTKMDRLDFGRIYAASIMYGYFLKSVSFRRQMDTSLNYTREDLQLHRYYNTCLTAGSCIHGFQTLVTNGQSTDTQFLELCHQIQISDTRPETLRSYVNGFDAQTLQRCAQIKSQESVNVIEKHAWALFGDDNMSEQEILITFASLERLVLEAAAFGTFLWDVERSVDSTYSLKKK